MIEINNQITIDESEIEFQFVRGGGPGGQNVNKLNTKVILNFDLIYSDSLSEPQKATLKRKLHSRLTNKGILQLSSHRHRSQLANREDVLNRFVEILRKAFRKKPKRLKTSIPKAAREKRLKQKKKLSRKKDLRKKDISWD